MNGDAAILRELMETKFTNVENRIDDLKNAVEKLAEATVRAERFDSALLKVRDLQAITKQLDNRLDETEGQVRIYKYVGGLIVAVIVAITIAWLKGVLGI